MSFSRAGSRQASESLRQEPRNALLPELPSPPLQPTRLRLGEATGPCPPHLPTICRTYYSRKSPQKQQLQVSQEQQQQQQRGRKQSESGTQPRRSSSVARLLAKLSPAKRRNAAKEQEPPAAAAGPVPAASAKLKQQQQRAVQASPWRQHGGGTNCDDGIPAFRPPSPPPEARLLTPPGCSSPGKAQLEAVRSLRSSPAAAPAPPARQQSQAPQGTPGLSQTSVGRAINDQIADSIADLFNATPPEVASSLQRASIDLAAAARASAGGAHWGQAPAEPARCRPSPFGAPMPEPPPLPPMLSTAMTGTPVALDVRGAVGGGPQAARGSPPAFLSPVFMSRKQRSLYCELDEPGR